jgi:hypothetical protein
MKYCLSVAIAKMTEVQNFYVMSDKFNLYILRICIDLQTALTAEIHLTEGW